MGNQMKATVNVHGDSIEVTWDGNMWTTSTGAQYASRSTAMRDEMDAYFRSCGEDIGDLEIQAQIDEYVSEIVIDRS